MSTCSSSGSSFFLEDEEILQFEARCKELRIEKDLLKQSSAELIHSLESHARTLSETRSNDKKRIQNLERELSNCSQELDYLQDQLTTQNTEMARMADYIRILELKVKEKEDLDGIMKNLEQELKANKLENIALMEKLEDKEHELYNSTLCIDKLEESISNIALDFQCDIESMKLDLMTMEHSFFEAKELQKEVVQEHRQMQELTKNYKIQIQNFTWLVEENKALRETLKTFESNADSENSMKKSNEYETQIHEYEHLVNQLKEQLKEEKFKANEEAEDLAQEMAELRYQLTGLLEEEYKKRACIEQRALQRITELESQAGVSLSEATTMVSTAPDYSINLAVVAPLTVKDLVATKTETKNRSLIVSDVCNVTADNEIAISKHMEGKIVLKDTQKPAGSSTSNQETPPPVADDSLQLDQESEEEKKKNQVLDTTQMVLDSASIKQEKSSSNENETLDQEFDNKNHDLLPKEAAVESLFICAIPEPGREYQKIVTVQMDESLFKTGVPITTSTSRPAVQSSNGDAENRPVVQSSNSDTQNKPAKSFDKNATGKQHGENINVLETWCEICKLNCNTNYNYNLHQTGKKHIKNLQKLEKIPTMPLAENLKPTKGEVVNPTEANSTMCELCAVYCTSRVMLDQHISGRKHQNNLKKCKNQLAPSHALDNKTPSPEPMYEEGEVVVSVRSKRKGDESWASEEDADSKRQKMNEKEGCGLLVICKGCNVVCNGLEAYNTHSCRF